VRAIVVGALYGIGFGICMVSGLVEVQALADPDEVAGLTAIYYSLTYIGFVLPFVLAALAPVASYQVSLLGVAVVCLACAAVAAGSARVGTGEVGSVDVGSVQNDAERPSPAA
jgi:hypothetical protein